MKRSGFARKAPPRPTREQRCAALISSTVRPIAQAVMMAGPARLAVPVHKGVTLQHSGYMDAVRSLPCYRCGHPPRSQFCHADEAKGTGIKSDCRLGWPGCAQCHHDIGTARVLPKAQRRAWEAAAGRATRAEVIRLGLWPARLPRWEER